MAKTFEEQIHIYSSRMAHMVYSKYVSESYFIQSCSNDYDPAKVESDKLRVSLATYGVECDKLVSCTSVYEEKKLNCYPICTPVDDDEDEVDTDNKICHQLFTQSIPSATWTIDIDPNLDFMPNVTTVTTISGLEVEIKGAVSYDETNRKVIVEFTHAFAGKAYLS